jgi:hypothetical protein
MGAKLKKVYKLIILCLPFALFVVPSQQCFWFLQCIYIEETNNAHHLDKYSYTSQKVLSQTLSSMILFLETYQIC